MVTLRRVADDCLPVNRLAVIRALRQPPELETSGVADLTRLTEILDDLFVLKVTSRREESLSKNWKKHYWSIISD